MIGRRDIWCTERVLVDLRNKIRDGAVDNIVWTDEKIDFDARRITCWLDSGQVVTIAVGISPEYNQG